jgi:hypothetical protein
MYSVCKIWTSPINAFYSIDLLFGSKFSSTCAGLNFASLAVHMYQLVQSHDNYTLVLAGLGIIRL